MSFRKKSDFFFFLHSIFFFLSSRKKTKAGVGYYYPSFEPGSDLIDSLEKRESCF